MDAVESGRHRLMAMEGVMESSKVDPARQGHSVNPSASAAASSTTDDLQAAIISAAVKVAEATAKATVDNAADTLVSTAVAAVTADVSAAIMKIVEGQAADAEARFAHLEAQVLMLCQVKGEHAQAAAAPGLPRTLEPSGLRTTVKVVEQSSTADDKLDEIAAAQAHLKDRLATLSASLEETVASRDHNSLEDSFISFMDTTSSCLQQHEQQIDAMKVRNLADRNSMLRTW
jgi:hypothetical protein